MAWTTFFRIAHKKGQSTDLKQKTKTKLVKVQRPVVGTTMEVIQQKRNQSEEERSRQREEDDKKNKEKEKRRMEKIKQVPMKTSKLQNQGGKQKVQAKSR